MKQAQVMISTGDNVVNLMPMLMHEFGECTAVIISSAFASDRRWSANLERVLKKEGKRVKIRNIPDEPPDLAALSEDICNELSCFDKVYFNISGGKKSQILLVLRIYQQRNRDEDRLIYSDSNPFRLLQFRGLEPEDPYKPRYAVSMENMLNLKGYTCQQYEGENRCNKLDIDQLSLPQEHLRKINELFLNKPLFAKLMYSYFSRMEVKVDEKQSDADRIRDLVKANRPDLEDCRDALDPVSSEQFEKASEAIEGLKEALGTGSQPTKNDLKTLWGKLKIIPNVKDTYSRYWGAFREKVVGLFMDNLERDDPILIDNKAEIEEILEMCNEWRDREHQLDGKIRHSDVEKLLGLENVRKGFLFEDMFSVLVWDTIESIDKDLLNHLYSNVEIYRLDTEESEDDSSGVKQRESFAEFDLVLVTAHGTLLVFECKTFGLEGDVVKSKNWSTFSHGGAWSEAMLVTHVQKKHFDVEDRAKLLFPFSLKAQLSSIQKYTRNNLWFFNEVEQKLRDKLAEKKKHSPS